MKKRAGSLFRWLPTVGMLLVLTACGSGGDGAFRTTVAGRWSGPLRLSSCIVCNNGASVCAGVGQVNRSVNFTVDSTPSEDRQTEVVSTQFDDCLYEGVRTEEASVTLESRGRCRGVIKFFPIDGASMELRVLPGEPPAAPSLECVANEWGTMSRGLSRSDG